MKYKERSIPPLTTIDEEILAALRSANPQQRWGFDGYDTFMYLTETQEIHYNRTEAVAILTLKIQELKARVACIQHALDLLRKGEENLNGSRAY